MVMNFDLALNPTSVIVFAVVFFSWGQGLLLIFLSHMERLAIKYGSYTETTYVWDYYTKEEFKEYKDTAAVAVTYNIYQAFYNACAVLAIVIFEVFHETWQLSEMLSANYGLKNESVVSLLYLLILRSLFFIGYFPINVLKLRVTRQAHGDFLWSLLWLYFKDLILILIFSIPASYVIKYFYRNIIFIISAIYFIVIMATTAINFNFFTTLEPLEDGLLRKTLEEKILPEIDFSINDIYHSNEESDEKVYFYDKWIRKTLVITGPLPVNKNVSLIGDTYSSVQFTVDEVIALIVFKIGESSKGYIFSTVLSNFEISHEKKNNKNKLLPKTGCHTLTNTTSTTGLGTEVEGTAGNMVHAFTLMLVCWHLYHKQYVLRMAGFASEKPAIANLLVMWYFVAQPYWSFVYYCWKCIYNFTQLTEAQFMVSHFSLQVELIRALVKVYQSNREFPYHDYCYAIFNGYKRPLHTLVISLSPPTKY